MSIVSGNAPWYEKSGMIQIPTVEPYDWGLNGVETYIPFGFSFPIGSYTVTGLYYSWDYITFCIDDAHYSWNDGNENLVYTFLQSSFSYGYSGEQVFYEQGTNYLRLRVYTHNDSGGYKDTEFVFFKNGNIQIKSSSNRTGSPDSDYGGYTVIGYISGTTDSKVINALVNDTTAMTSGESIVIERVSSTNYVVHHNSYWENDRTYTLPLKSRIISEILLLKKKTDGNSSYISSNGRTYSIPVFSPSVYSSPLRINTPDGIGCIKTQTPVTPNALNPPIYVEVGGSKVQLSLGYSGTSEYVYRGYALNAWGNCSNNLNARNNSSYHWITPSYRYFEEPITGVYSIVLRAGVKYNSKITKTMYVYYSSSNTDNQSSSNFTYLDSFTATGTSGEYKTMEISLTNKTVGAVMVVTGISGSNATGGVEFDSTIMCKVKNGAKLY